MIRIIFLYIVSVQILLILWLVGLAVKRNKLQNSVNIISVKGITSSQSGSLNYFYEPKPGTIISQDLSWMGDQYNYGAIYKINSDGLNQVNDIKIEKDSGVFRILTIGDSLTFGQNVDTEANYPSNLQKLLKTHCSQKVKFEVINLGERGYDIQYAVHRLQIRGVKYKPDTVLWYFIDQDFLRFDEKLIPLVRKYSKEIEESGESDVLKRRGIAYPAWKKAVDSIVEDIGGEDAALALQRKYLDELKTIYEGPLILLTSQEFPKKYTQFLDAYLSTRQNAYRYGGLTDLNRAKAIFPDFHPTPKGYKILAEDIFSYLVSSKRIPCN